MIIVLGKVVVLDLVVASQPPCAGVVASPAKYGRAVTGIGGVAGRREGDFHGLVAEDLTGPGVASPGQGGGACGRGDADVAGVFTQG